MPLTKADLLSPGFANPLGDGDLSSNPNSSRSTRGKAPRILAGIRAVLFGQVIVSPLSTFNSCSSGCIKERLDAPTVSSWSDDTHIIFRSWRCFENGSFIAKVSSQRQGNLFLHR